MLLASYSELRLHPADNCYHQWIFQKAIQHYGNVKQCHGKSQCLIFWRLSGVWVKYSLWFLYHLLVIIIDFIHCETVNSKCLHWGVEDASIIVHNVGFIQPLSRNIVCSPMENIKSWSELLSIKSLFNFIALLLWHYYL